MIKFMHLVVLLKRLEVTVRIRIVADCVALSCFHLNHSSKLIIFYSSIKYLSIVYWWSRVNSQLGVFPHFLHDT